MGSKVNIVYNVHDRGRSKAIGKDRHFDLRALAALVNGPEVQERVKNRDLTGYYGHIVRMKYGIQPPETVFEDGKAISIEPAVVTTALSCDDEGNITHETEFLNTLPGEMAERCHNSRQGGFSSAIFAKPRGSVDVPLVFAGFDYVFEPNYTTNRGYLLDSTGAAGGLDGMMLDAVMADWHQSTAAMKALYDSMERDHVLATEALRRAQEENEELLSMLAAAGRNGTVLLDSTGEDGARPFVARDSRGSALVRGAALFATKRLEPFATDSGKNAADASDDATLAAAKRHYGVTA